MLGLDEIKAGCINPLQQLNDIAMADNCIVLARITATPVIRAECLRKTIGPDLGAPVRDHLQVHHLTTGLHELLCQFLGRQIAVVDKHIDTDQILLRRFRHGQANAGLVAIGLFR